MPSLGYWKIRGLAQPIRLLLHYAGEHYDDVMYEHGDAPDYSREQWMSVKHSLGLPFPNLPYYIDGDIKVTQSNAIIRYIARKHNLLGKTEQEKVAVDVLLDQAMDFRNALVNLVYSVDYITAPDFVLYELLDQHRLMKEDCLTDFPKLLTFLDRIEAEPNIKAYMASDKFIQRPVNGKMAQFK